MGKFDDSIVQYRKALSIDKNFVPSHFGIAADLMYLGKPAEAEAELQAMASQARNDGELRTALFGMAVVAADSGKFDKAQQQMDKEYAVAEKKNDTAAMAADLQAKGNIALAMQNYALAKQHFDRSLELTEGSGTVLRDQEQREARSSLQPYGHCNWQQRLRGCKVSRRGIPGRRRCLQEFRADQTGP